MLGERRAIRDRQPDREKRNKDRNKNSGWSSVDYLVLGQTSPPTSVALWVSEYISRTNQSIIMATSLRGKFAFCLMSVLDEAD